MWGMWGSGSGLVVLRYVGAGPLQIDVIKGLSCSENGAAVVRFENAARPDRVLL